MSGFLIGLGTFGLVISLALYAAARLHLRQGGTVSDEARGALAFGVIASFALILATLAGRAAG